MTPLKRSRAVLPLAVLSVGLLLAAPAQASPQDARFLDQLSRDGVVFTDFVAMLDYAHGICAWLDAGTPHLDVVDAVMLDNPQLDWDHAAALTINAYLTYCPWHALPATDEPGGASTGVAYA